MDLYALIPSDLTIVSAGGLVALSFFTSALTAAVGIGGGLVLLAVMASFLPPLVVLPVHGIVQLGSNGGRAVVMRPHIDWQITGYFVLGSLIGVILAAKVFVVLPVEVLREPEAAVIRVHGRLRRRRAALRARPAEYARRRLVYGFADPP